MTIPQYVIGTEEYLVAEVVSDVSLTTQVVTVLFNGDTLPAGWIGSAGTTRSVRTTSVVDFTDVEPGVYEVLVDIVDSPESPILSAGYINVRPA